MIAKNIFFLTLLSAAADVLGRYFFNTTFNNKFAGILCAILVFHLLRRKEGWFVCFLFFAVAIRLSLLGVQNGFHASDLYDVFAIGFSSLYMTYLSGRNLGNRGGGAQYVRPIQSAYILIVFTFILFSPTFINIDFFSQDIEARNFDDIESIRDYRSGLFAIPQMPAYLFFFSAFSLLTLLKVRAGLDRRRLYCLIIGAFACTFLVGSRAPFYSVALLVSAYFAFSAGIKNRIRLLLIALSVFLFILYIDEALRLVENTMLYQYFSFAKTALENYERLSRYMIWSAWLDAERDLGFLGWIFGAGFHSSLLSNQKHLGLAIWFHNDVLSIVYSWGVLGLLLYSYPFIIFFKRFKNEVLSSPSSFVLFFSLPFMAITNGLYFYYSPLFYYLCYQVFFRLRMSNHTKVIKVAKSSAYLNKSVPG